MSALAGPGGGGEKGGKRGGWQGKAVGGWSHRPMPRRRIRPPPHPHPSGIQVGAASTGLPELLSWSCWPAAGPPLQGPRGPCLRVWPSFGASVPWEPSPARLQEGRRAAWHRRIASGGGGPWRGRRGRWTFVWASTSSSQVDMQFLTLFIWLLMVAGEHYERVEERVSAAGAWVREGIPPRRSIRAGDTRRRCQAGGQRCAPSQLYLSVCWCTATASPQQRVAAHSRRGSRLCDTAVPPPRLSHALDFPQQGTSTGNFTMTSPQ